MKNKSSPEYKRVRTEIAKKYCGHNSKIGFILADRILEIKGLAILCDDQSVPEPCFCPADYANKQQVEMLNAGFVKVVK